MHYHALSADRLVATSVEFRPLFSSASFVSGVHRFGVTFEFPYYNAVGFVGAKDRFGGLDKRFSSSFYPLSQRNDLSVTVVLDMNKRVAFFDGDLELENLPSEVWLAAASKMGGCSIKLEFSSQ